MFGYLNIEKDKLEEGKRGLWQSFMCGMCISTKKQFGNLPRMFISNDVNFFNVLFHSATDSDVTVERHRCVSSPFVKRAILAPTELCDKMAVANVLLNYWNLYDDAVDGGSVNKKTALRALRPAYKKARVLMSDLDELIARRYDELRQMERSSVGSLDRVSHSFAQLTQDFADIVLDEQSNDYIRTLCYNLGKWIYLIDGLDDVEKDLKKGNYNPFVSCYGVTSARQLSDRYDELKFLMYAVLNRVAMSYNDLNLGKYACILTNVLFDGIRDKTKQILVRYKPDAKSDGQTRQKACNASNDRSEKK